MKYHILYIKGIEIRRSHPPILPANKLLKPRNKQLRKMGNYSEVVFWKQVHKGKFWKLDFDRQRIIGNYIVDFYIKSLGVVIEIDGELHNEQLEYDTKRDKYLESLGLKIIRFTNLCVLYDLGNVITTLEEFIISNYRVL